MSSKGMVYTTFAIVATSMLILLVSFTAVDNQYTSDTNPFRIGQASFYLENVAEDLNRAYRIAFQRGTSGAVNYIVETGNSTDRPIKALSNATVNGTVNGYVLANAQNATLRDWKERVEAAASGSKYSLNIEYRDLEVQDNYMMLQANLSTFLTLKDPVSLARFNETKVYRTEASIRGLEDAMILLRTKGRYINTYKACGYNEPAKQLLTGTENNEGATYGNATIETSDSADLDEIDNRSEKILVTDNVAAYVPDQIATLNEFAGLVSAQPMPTGGGGPGGGPPGGPPGGGGGSLGTSPDDYSTKYIFDTGTINPVNEDMRLILYEDMVWNSNIREAVNSGCYLRSKAETGMSAGPGFLERMENSLTANSSETQGLSTLINKTEVPGEFRELEASNVGYVYFNDTGNYGTVNAIAGVTGDKAFADREYIESFRLDQEHLEAWNMQDLAY